MIYEHFNMRLHVTEYYTQNPSSWDIRVGDGVLNAFTVGSIVNPKPVVKKNLLDINGMSGSLDLTEESGRVFFENKTVTVILQGRADFAGMDDVESFFAPYQGRLMDFTTDNYLSVSGFQVGRMAAEINKRQNRVTITLDTEPFKYSESITRKTLVVLPNYERDVNTSDWDDGWIVDGGSNDFDVLHDVPGGIRYADSSTNVIVEREKTVGSENNGKFLALGIVSIQGGDMWFEWEDGNKTIQSRTLAKVQNGKIKRKVTIDGSLFEWVTVNGTRKYMATVRVNYVLVGFLPTEDGEVASSVSDELPTNVIIRPAVSTTYHDGYIVCDGVCVNVRISPRSNAVSKIVMPGNRADFSKPSFKSVCVVFPTSSGNNPTCTIEYRRPEVF